MHGLLPERVGQAVMDAMNDQEALTTPLLQNEEAGRQFAMLVLKMLVGRTERDMAAG